MRRDGKRGRDGLQKGDKRNYGDTGNVYPDCGDKLQVCTVYFTSTIPQ